jgi:hypothetical protein
MNIFPTRWRRFLAPEILFTSCVYIVLLALFSVLRLLLLWRNAGMARDIPSELLINSFWVGLRFDLAVGSYLLIPLFLLLLVLRGRLRVRLLTGFSALVGAVVLLGLIEIEFFRELEFRFNTVAFEYLNHPRIVAGMAWEGYPVLRYMLVWAVLTALFACACSWLYRRILLPPSPVKGTPAILPRTMGVMLMMTLMIFASRGGFAHEPLRWGDAFFSEEPFANDLALNGLFTLARSVLENGGENHWTGTLAVDEARRLTRQMLLLPHETDLSSGDYPILRREGRPAGAVPLLRNDSARPMNVVVILMESFSGRYTGALGAPGGISGRMICMKSGPPSLNLASQVDIGASVLGLLGLEMRHQSWGRNLFDSGLKDDGFAVIKPSGGENRVAVVEGDYVLIRDAKGDTLLYRCDFGFPSRVELLPKGEAAERRATMLRKMQAYVETGLISLRDRKLGVPGDMEERYSVIRDRGLIPDGG